MFYGEDNNGKITIENIIDDLYLNDGESYKKNRLEENYNRELSHLVEIYSSREEYINDLLNRDGFREIVNKDVENQIIELFENVKNAIAKGDENLLSKCIETISVGKENVIKFIDEQSEYLDDRSMKIMNVILSEYSYHINHLNKAIDIIKNY